MKYASELLVYAYWSTKNAAAFDFDSQVSEVNYCFLRQKVAFDNFCPYKIVLFF